MDFYNKENKKQILIFTLIIVIIIFVAVFSNVFQSDKKTEDPQKDFSFINLITAEHNFKSGLHDYTGTIIFPTPCYRMSVDAVVKESFPEDVTIRFTIEEDKTTEICAQVITEKNSELFFKQVKRRLLVLL